MFALSNGHALPSIDRIRICEILGHEGWVLVQTAADSAELRVEGSIRDDQKAALHTILETVTSELEIQFKTVERLPLTSGGKRHFCVNASV
jgi:hypothetical protein